jgi:hypothetical protein
MARAFGRMSAAWNFRMHAMKDGIRMIYESCSGLRMEIMETLTSRLKLRLALIRIVNIIPYLDNKHCGEH